jgi:hypothetical protein
MVHGYIGNQFQFGFRRSCQKNGKSCKNAAQQSVPPITGKLIRPIG